MVVDSGHTYEGAPSWIFRRSGVGPARASRLSSTKVMANWAVRNVVQDWLDKHPAVTPDDWDGRELLEPSRDDGTRPFDDEGDLVLRTWRAMCPDLQERWLVNAQPEHWEGVMMENSRVVKLELTTEIPAEIGQLTALEIGPVQKSADERAAGDWASECVGDVGPRKSADERAGGDRAAHLAENLILQGNLLLSVPAEIGQLTSLTVLYLDGNRLTSVPAEIGQLTSLTDVVPRRQSADERALGDWAGR